MSCFEDDVKYYFNLLTINTPAFAEWRYENKTDFNELIKEVVFNCEFDCEFDENAYNSCNVENVIWNTIADHEEFEHMFD